MGSPIMVGYPARRLSVVGTLADWADVDYQRRQWIAREHQDRGFSEPFYSIDEFEQLGLSSLDSRAAVGDVIGGSELPRVQALISRLGPLLEDEDLDTGNYATFLGHSAWPEIVSRCRRATTLIVLGGGTIDLKFLPDRDPAVLRTEDRSLVAHALASIAEATYRQPGEYSDEDAPAYLITPEQAIDTLLATGHLDDPRSQIGVIYRDTYEEIPRLEALHDSVIRYKSGDITLADLADPAVDALCSIIRSGAGWDLNFDELAAARQRAAEG